ncbi:hypothetical protein [Myroides odoratimimus]|uniref:hypothetical protein n=1 Tax=Myroides odoratimimus TaxID=76832 RepID=UPI0031014E90
MKKIFILGTLMLLSSFTYAQQIEKGKKPLVIDEKVVEIESKVYLVINKKDAQKLNTGGTTYNAKFDGAVEGINKEKIKISSNQEEIIFPPNKVFRVTGAIGVRGANASGIGTSNPGYITSEFQIISGGKSLVSTKGYTESSTETFDDGGVTQPVMILTSNEDGARLNLKVRYGGGQSGTNGYYLAGQATNSTVGTYILIEEL